MESKMQSLLSTRSLYPRHYLGNYMGEIKTLHAFLHIQWNEEHSQSPMNCASTNSNFFTS